MNRETARFLSLLVLVGILVQNASAGAHGLEGWELGARFSVMPAGTFALNYSDNHIGTVDSAPTILALGGGAFVDHAFNPYLALGLGAEAVLNVIPDVPHNEVGQIFNVDLRLKAGYPLARRAVLYAVLGPGFGVIFGLRDDPLGFTLAATAGGSFRVTPRNALLVEVGYLAGFQRRAGERYSPSYLVTSIGWQLSL